MGPVVQGTLWREAAHQMRMLLTMAWRESQLWARFGEDRQFDSVEILSRRWRLATQCR